MRPGAATHYALFMTRRGSPESLPLNIPDARLLGVSPTGDLAFLRGSHNALRLLAPPGTGTLTRVAMTGGGPREILDDVVAADWAPGGELAVVRRDRVEFPLGKTIHGPHQFRYVRVAPDGQRLALADRRAVVVLDRSGNKTTLSSGWGELITVAWSPSGHEVWFAAEPRAKRRFALDGTRRLARRGGARRVLLCRHGAGHSGRVPRRPRLDRHARGKDGVFLPAARTSHNLESWRGSTAPRPRRSRPTAARCC